MSFVGKCYFPMGLHHYRDLVGFVFLVFGDDR